LHPGRREQLAGSPGWMPRRQPWPGCVPTSFVVTRELAIDQSSTVFWRHSVTLSGRSEYLRVMSHWRQCRSVGRRMEGA
jgi:hypothetical protein